MAELVVQIRQGKLRGKTEKTRDGVEYNSYRGIPYAKPPVGPLRFKDPEPALSWEGEREATKMGNVAFQFDFFGKEISGSDDCLFLNIFVPSHKKDGLIPVMVYIHGGGFISGSSDDLGPDYLIKEGVILVTLNYRLGVMGFLCTDAINARGDMGLKDQLMALTWVKENIDKFQGDPNNVTLFGISAGSASVEYHLLSKQSRGMFHKAILQSGSCLNPWARTIGGVEKAKRLAIKMGYTGEGTVYEYLNRQETLDLVKATVDFVNSDDVKSGMVFGFGPVCNELENYAGFVEGEPSQLLKTGNFIKVPTISGLCEKEGMMMSAFYVTPENASEFKEKMFREYIPRNSLNGDRLDVALKTTYDKKHEDENTLDFLSDLCFNGGCVYSLQQRLKHKTDEYFYEFTYDGNQNMVKTIMKMDKEGACHGDDTTYIGPVRHVNPDDATHTDLKVRDNLVKMWTNFAKIGNPTPESFQGTKWLQCSKEDMNFLEIGQKLEMHSYFNPDRTKLWENIYNNIQFKVPLGTK